MLRTTSVSHTKKLLLVSATETECTPTLPMLTNRETISPWLYAGNLQEQPIEILVSGIGVVATTFRLTQTLMQRSYSHAVSIGIAGSYDETISIGETVQITGDCFADLGIDNNGQFRSLQEEGLICDDSGDSLLNPSPVLSSHRKVQGITVQTATGSKDRIDKLVNSFHPQVETMENAAFFYVCKMMQIPFASFRAISNKVEPRNRKSWRVAEAIENINKTLVESLLCS